MQQIQESIRDAIEAIHLPAMPQVLLRFMHLVEDDRASLAELATLAGQDPALCARFFTLANSSLFRSDKKIKSLEQCLMTIGPRLARTLAACLAVQTDSSYIAGEQYYDLRGFWAHSVRVAETARALAVKTGYSESADAYLAGLMHDIGQLLLMGGLGERYEDVLRNNIDEATLRDLEESLFSTDHAAVGALLVDQWQLPTFLSDAVLFHHRGHDEIVDADILSKIVWSAHVLSSYHDKIELKQKDKSPDLATVRSLWGLSTTDLETIRKEAAAQVAQVATSLGIAESAEIRSLPSPVVPFEHYRPRHYDDNPAHARIEARVRDMAVVQALDQHLALLSSEEEILLALREAARILFGLGRLAIFYLEPHQQTLSTRNFLGQPVMLQRLEIRLDPEQSLIAAATLGQAPCSTFAEERPARISLVDHQIARALGSEGVLYVPMPRRDLPMGVMAYGLNGSQHARMQSLLPRLTSFARQAAGSIQTWQEMKEREQKVTHDLASHFQQHARKVVHEAGNPLRIIKNYLQIISQKAPESSEVGEELGILREEIERVALIVQRFGNLTETAQHTATVDINTMIEGLLALYSESLFSANGISVDMELAPVLPPILGDRDSIKQILLNLWKNAAEAMTAGGSFSIATCDNVNLNGRFYTEIRLSDTGPGLPPDVLQQLFQPLDPNRRPDHAGLGLSIVASLVERLEGSIKCQSNTGTGTSFTILLPRTMERLQ